MYGSTQDSLFFLCPCPSPVSGPPLTHGRRKEGSPRWPRSMVLSCASRGSTSQIMASTSAAQRTTSDRTRGSIHSRCKVTRKSEKRGGGQSERGMFGGEDIEKELSSSFYVSSSLFFLFLSFVVAFACTSIFFLF